MGALTIHEHLAPNNDGWLLRLRQVYRPDKLNVALRPVMIVPGYGMNSFIFSFHPRGTSMEACLAAEGFEVWSVDLRAQGDSRPVAGRRKAPAPSMRGYADVDLTAAIHAALTRTRSRATQMDLIGCSLGGTISYAHVALRPDHRVGSVISVGSPLRWLTVPSIFKAAFFSPKLVGMIPITGSRFMLSRLFPILGKVPGALDIYLNSAHVDIAAAHELTRTVEDPHPGVNRELAEWINATDLSVGGVNITQALKQVDIPLLVMISNRDGIVPSDAALSAMGAWGGHDVSTHTVGDDSEWFAHADLFIANSAPEKVFAPIAQWLHARQS